jgi:hypothetical protein
MGRAMDITMQPALARVPLARRRNVRRMLKPKRRASSLAWRVGPNEPAHVADQEHADYCAQNRQVARPPPIAIPKSPTPNMARARDEFVPMCIPSSRGRESLQWNHTTHPRPRAGPAITGQPAAVLAWDWRADKASKVGLSRSRALRQGCRRLERMLAQGPFMITSETGIRVPRPLRLPTPEYPKPTVSRPDHSKSIWFRNRVGALLGTALAWLVFDGREMWVWGSFRLHVSANLWTLGLLWTLVTSLVGGLTPALRAARLPASEALRAA